MSTIKLTAFTGEMPRTTPRLLPATGAQMAQSVRLEDGELAPYRKPFPVMAVDGIASGQIKSIYRHLGTWYAWDHVVNAAPGPVAQDRLYYTGDGKPKMRVGSTVYDLALTPPATALTVAATGTLDTTTSASRLYVYTRVTDYGEESEPSPISNEIQWSSGMTVTLSGFVAAPAGRAFSKQRIYRSQSGSTGGANLYFIAERADTSANFIDTVGAADFNEPLSSLEWTPPIDTLQGLVAMPNGMMAAYSGKDLYFCEPYRPHAWPVKYSQATNYDITGLAVSGSTLIIGTKGNPYIAGGTTPDTITMQLIDLLMPCVNPRGMVDMGYAALYPSNDGLVQVQDGMPNLISGPLLTRDQWRLLDPANLVCGQFYGRFYASYRYTDDSNMSQEGTLIFDITGEQPYLIRSQHRADAMFYDVTDNKLYMAIGTTIYEWDAKESDNDVMTYRSKAYLIPQPTSFGAILVESDQRQNAAAVSASLAARAAVQTYNNSLLASGHISGALGTRSLGSAPVNGDFLKAMPSGPQIAVNVYADGEFLGTVTDIGTTERLPPTLARQWEVEVTGNIPVQQITMAGTAQELRQIP